MRTRNETITSWFVVHDSGSNNLIFQNDSSPHKSISPRKTYYKNTLLNEIHTLQGLNRQVHSSLHSQGQAFEMLTAPKRKRWKGKKKIKLMKHIFSTNYRIWLLEIQI